MLGQPALWHELEVGEDKGYKFGAVKMNPECGCSHKEPCDTLRAYYTHNLVPDQLPNGQYRMRLGIFGYLEVEAFHVKQRTDG